MPVRVPFTDVAAGVAKDPLDWQLPAGVWTRAENVRFLDGAAWKTSGYQKVWEPPSVAPHFAMPVQLGTDNWWVYAGLTKVYGLLNGTHSNITRQAAGVDLDYTGTAIDRWNGCVLETVPILNNGIDKPQQWLPVDAGTDLADLSNWPATVRAKVIRSFKNYLIALDVTKAGTRYPTLVKWSHPADPGTIPSSWDESDPTVDANEYPLNANGDPVVDCLPLGDTNVIYKETSTHGMSYIGGSFVFRFFQMFKSAGMLAQRCAVEIDRKHFVVTGDDVVIHDGQTANSVLNSIDRRTLFTEISSDNYRNSFVVRNRDAKEIWFCYPTSFNASPYPTRALVYNEVSGAVAFKDLDSFREGDYGRVPVVGLDDWASDSQAWALDDSPWTQAIFGLNKGIILPDPVDTHLQMMERTYQADGVNISAYLERTAIRFPAIQGAEWLNNLYAVKQITNIYPHVEAEAGTTVYFVLGASPGPNLPVVWGEPKPYVVGTDTKVDYIMPGKLLAMRMISIGNERWKLTGFDLDVNFLGNF